MSEQEPQPKPLIIEIGDERFECLPDNTVAKIHQEEHEAYDCILHVGETQHVALFRENFSEGFDDLVETMMNMGFVVSLDDEPTVFYKNLYLSSFGRDPKHKTALQEKGLTPRQKKIVKFLKYLLKHEHLTPEDFDGKGDLFI